VGRKNQSRRGKREEPEALDLDRVRMGIRTTVIKGSISFTKQSHSGASAEEGKKWTCPFCNGTFGEGVAHVVAWETDLGPSIRRHFHSMCFSRWQGRIN
jgi:hypothetical protein